MSKYAYGLGLLLLWAACRPPEYTPKPTGYFKIDTPDHHIYQTFDKPGYPYIFEYPKYAQTSYDSTFFKEKADNPYWLNIEYPALNATINLTYKSIPNHDAFVKMIQDSYGMSFFHHTRADYIKDEFFYNKNGLTLILYSIGGNAASAYQFIATDSSRHFMRGALYFPVSPNADSLKPATDFIKQDIVHMMETLRFRSATRS